MNIPRKFRLVLYTVIFMGFIVGPSVPHIARAFQGPTPYPPPNPVPLEGLYVGLILAGFAGATTLLGWSLRTTYTFQKTVTSSFAVIETRIENGLDRVEAKAASGRAEMETRVGTQLDKLESDIKEMSNRLGRDINQVNSKVDQHHVVLLGMPGETSGGLTGEVKALRVGRHDLANEIMKAEGRIMEQVTLLKQKIDT